MEEQIKHQIISFEKTFEFTCLVEFMQERYPRLTEEKIKSAIAMCLKKTKPPRLEDHFIRLLRKELEIT